MASFQSLNCAQDNWLLQGRWDRLQAWPQAIGKVQSPSIRSNVSNCPRPQLREGQVTQTVVMTPLLTPSTYLPLAGRLRLRSKATLFDIVPRLQTDIPRPPQARDAASNKVLVLLTWLDGTFWDLLRKAALAFTSAILCHSWIRSWDIA